MINLIIKKNIILIPKSQEGYHRFVEEFLVKYENVLVPDTFASRLKRRKQFKSVKERRELFTENDDFIIFARGLLEMIPQSTYNVFKVIGEDTLKIPDLTVDQIRKTLPMFDLRDDQVTAVNKGLKIKRGVIQLPTAIGKSAIISTIIKRLHEVNPEMKSLVLAPTLSTVENINRTLLKSGIESKEFNKVKNLDSPVTTSLVQSLIIGSESNPNLLEGVGAVFYDECLPLSAKILLSDFSEASIASIYNDDSINSVMSYNIETKTYEVKKIIRKFKTPFNNKFWKVYYENPTNGLVEGITLTNNHKIYTMRGYVKAEELIINEDRIKIDPTKIRSTVLAPHVFAKVIAVRPNVGSTAKYKYNIEVEDNHNYFADGVLVSNCHHLKCDTWSKLNSLIPNAEYSLGFSALSIDKSEIFNTDIRQMSYESSLIVGCTGRVLMHMDPSYYIDKGIIALPVVFRVGNRIDLTPDFDESAWAQLVKTGIMGTSRSALTSKIASMFSKYNRKVLILVSEKNHAFVLGRYLKLQGCDNFGISFGAGVGFVYNESGPYENNETCYDKKESMLVLEDLSEGRINILIATSHLDEGVDVSSLDACILACGGKKDRKIIQRVGRVLRKSKSGKYAYVIDFTDFGSRVLSKQSKERLRLYRDDIGVPQETIYDNINEDLIETTFRRLEGIDS